MKAVWPLSVFAVLLIGCKIERRHSAGINVRRLPAGFACRVGIAGNIPADINAGLETGALCRPVLQDIRAIWTWQDSASAERTHKAK